METAVIDMVLSYYSFNRSMLVWYHSQYGFSIYHSINNMEHIIQLFCCYNNVNETFCNLQCDTNLTKIKGSILSIFTSVSIKKKHIFRSTAVHSQIR